MLGVAAVVLVAFVVGTLALTFDWFGLKPRIPTMTVRGVDTTRVDLGGLGLRLHLAAHNPNRVDVRVRSVTGRVTALGRDLGTTEVPLRITLRARAETPFDVDFAVPWSDVPGLVLASVGTDRVPFDVNGTASVAVKGVRFDAPFHVTGTIPRDMLVRAAMGSIPQLPSIPSILFPGSHHGDGGTAAPSDAHDPIEIPSHEDHPL